MTVTMDVRAGPRRTKAEAEVGGGGGAGTKTTATSGEGYFGRRLPEWSSLANDSYLQDKYLAYSPNLNPCHGLWNTMSGA